MKPGQCGKCKKNHFHPGECDGGIPAPKLEPHPLCEHKVWVGLDNGGRVLCMECGWAKNAVDNDADVKLDEAIEAFQRTPFSAMYQEEAIRILRSLKSKPTPSGKCGECGGAIHYGWCLKCEAREKSKPTPSEKICKDCGHRIVGGIVCGCDPSKPAPSEGEKPRVEDWSRIAAVSLHQDIAALEKRVDNIHSDHYGQGNKALVYMLRDDVLAFKAQIEKLHRRTQKAEGEVEQLWKTITHMGKRIDELSKEKEKPRGKKERKGRTRTK